MALGVALPRAMALRAPCRSAPSRHLSAARPAFAVAPARTQRYASSSSRLVVMAAARSIHELSIPSLGSGTRSNPVDGPLIDLAQCKGKVVLIENVATLWGTTVRDFIQMNDLTAKYGNQGFRVLAVPTNQFGRQTNERDFEILNTLKYVRPGNGYEPLFPLTTKVDANGKDAHPLFVYLRNARPTVDDTKGDAGAEHIMDNLTHVIWSPVTRNDITWNFEKFLINQDGVCVRRFSPKFETKDIEPFIVALLQRGPNALDR